MAVFDENKVRTEWSDELEGKKGWFSDLAHGTDNQWIGSYVTNECKKFYGVCHKNGVNGFYPFLRGAVESWRCFYPDDEAQMEFDKSNLFIAGYNDEGLKKGDIGFYATSIDNIKLLIKGRYNYTPFNGFNVNGVSFFYRTKCAPQKKYIPWTNETAPDLLGEIIINKTDTDHRSIIIDQAKGGIFAVGAAIDYKWLFDHYIMSDGTPCGQEVK